MAELAPVSDAATDFSSNDDAATAAEAPAALEAKHGFRRPDFGTLELAGSVAFYERHIFLSYKGPAAWPSHVDSAESDILPRQFAAAIAANKGRMAKQPALTLCEGEDGPKSSNGDVLIFPDMVRYRGLTDVDIDNFVEEVLVKGAEWYSGSVEPITGSYIFVCCHASRDRNCGICGPVLLQRFKDEINSRHLDGEVFATACSHVGQHKYAGNVIIFTPNINGEVSGHWYGYVAPEDVSVLLDQHVGKGEIVDRLWRGQMGLTKEEQKKALESRRAQDGAQSEANTVAADQLTATAGCPCQAGDSAACCRNAPPVQEDESAKRRTSEHNPRVYIGDKNGNGGGDKKARKPFALPTWLESWEKEDTYAAIAVVMAIASVFVAIKVYKNHISNN